MICIWKRIGLERISLFVGVVSGCVAEITRLSIFEKGGGFSSRVWAFSIVGEGHVVGDGVGRCVDGGVVDCGVLVYTTWVCWGFAVVARNHGPYYWDSLVKVSSLSIHNRQSFSS